MRSERGSVISLSPVLVVLFSESEMGAAPGSGWEEGEFEFKLVFEEDPPRQSRCGPEETESGQTHHEPAGMCERWKGGEAIGIGMVHMSGYRSGLVTDVLGAKTVNHNLY